MKLTIWLPVISINLSMFDEYLVWIKSASWQYVSYDTCPQALTREILTKSFNRLIAKSIWLISAATRAVCSIDFASLLDNQESTRSQRDPESEKHSFHKYFCANARNDLWFTSYCQFVHPRTNFCICLEIKHKCMICQKWWSKKV